MFGFCVPSYIPPLLDVGMLLISFGVLMETGELKSNADAAVGPTLLFIGLYELVFAVREAGLEAVIIL